MEIVMIQKIKLRIKCHKARNKNIRRKEESRST